jgi:hypothetical protein
MGTSLPSVAGEFLSDGAVDKMFLWDPLVAGQAQDKLALMLIKGEKIAPGLDLGLPGYRNLKRIPGTPHALAGSGWIMVDKSNARHRFRQGYRYGAEFRSAGVALGMRVTVSCRAAYRYLT